MRIPLLLIAGCFAVAGCIDVPWADRAEAAPAGPIQAFPPGAALDDGLGLIAAVLDSAIASGLEGDGVAQLLRVETLTDRILETEIPFGWLASVNYSVEARVWQIQARADRIVARLRADVRREDLLPEASALRDDVASLRTALSANGTAAPPPLDRLLLRLDSVTRTRRDTAR